MSSFLYVVVLTLSLVCRLSATPVVYRRSGDETCPTFPSYQNPSFLGFGPQLSPPIGNPKAILLGIGFTKYSCEMYHQDPVISEIPTLDAPGPVWPADRDMPLPIAGDSTLYDVGDIVSSFESNEDRAKILYDLSTDKVFHLLDSSSLFPEGVTPIGSEHTIRSSTHFNLRKVLRMSPAEEVPAPDDPNAKGSGDVLVSGERVTDGPSSPGLGGADWQKFKVTDFNYKMDVYKVSTVGGKAPPSCEGLPLKFEITSTAMYWIYGPLEFTSFAYLKVPWNYLCEKR